MARPCNFWKEQPKANPKEEFFASFEFHEPIQEVAKGNGNYVVVDIKEQFPWIHQYLLEKNMPAAVRKFE